MSFAATRKLFVLFFCWTWIPNNSMESDLLGNSLTIKISCINLWFFLVFTNSQPMLSTGPNSTDIELPVKAMDPVKISPNVEFPENAKIFLNATQWARVSEPLVPVNVSSNFRFRITKAVVDVFGVTKKSGIIYLKETNDFKDLISAIHRITVSWNLASKPSVIQSALIDVMLMKADNSTCSNNMTDHTDNFCAKFKVNSFFK